MATPTIREVLSDRAENADVTLVTGSGTQATDMLVALQGIDFYAAASMVSPTPGTWANDATGDRGTNAPHIKAWTRLAGTTGAQSVTFEQVSDAVNHGILLVLAGANLTVDGAAGGSGTDDTQDAPSVAPAAGDALLICAWLSNILGDYAPPAGMAEVAESDFSPWATMAAATEVLTAAGATGVRTATFSVSRAFASVSLAISAADGGAVDLVVQDATQAQTVDAIALTQVHSLVVADAAQAQTADAITLSQVHALAVADATQAQSTDGVALTQVHQLAVADAVQTHTADQVTLTQTHQLTVADASHAQTADSITLAVGGALVVADARHVQAVDAVTLTQVHQLVVQDARHAQLADAVVFAGDDPEPGVLVAGGTSTTLTAAGAPASTLTAAGTAATLTAAAAAASTLTAGGTAPVLTASGTP